MFGGQDHRDGGVIDTDRLEFDTTQHERQLAEGRAGDDGAVRSAAPVTRAVSGGHTHCHRGQTAVARRLQYQAFGLYPGSDVRGEFPLIGDDVGLASAPALPAVNGGVGAGEDKPMQRSAFGDSNHIPSALDIGMKQRGGVGQPAAGIDHAVVDVIASGHCRAQRVVVPDVTDVTFDREVIDADGVGAVAHHHPNVVAGCHQLTCDVRAEKTVGADDEFRCAHRAVPFLAIQAAAASSRVPSFSAFLHHFIDADRNRNGL